MATAVIIMAVIANTMPTEQWTHFSFRPGGFAVLTLGVALLVSALPHLIAQARLTFTDLPRAELDDSAQGAEIARALAIRQQLDVKDSRLIADTATLHLALARAEKTGWLGARAALESALMGRPLDGLLWARLAYVLAEGSFTPPLAAPAAVSPLLQSMALARFAPEYMSWRFIMAAKLWPDMLAAQQDVVADQAGLMWRKKTRNFIRLARIPALAPALEVMMTRYYPDESARFLRERGPLRHTSKHQER